MNRVICAGALLAALLLSTSCIHYHHVMRKPGINDGKEYGRVPLPPAEGEAFQFHRPDKHMELPPLSEWASDRVSGKYGDPQTFIADNGTTALLIVRNDTLLYEQYYNGYDAATITQVFSVTKPLTASFLAQALAEGRIASLDEPVDQYFDLRKRKKYTGALTLRHLANMQSGLNHSDYWHLAKIIRFYHAKDADRYLRKAKVFREPGTKFTYKSIDTQLLGTCLESIFGEKDLMDRFVKTYWNTIGPEFKGYFSVDHPESKNLKYYGGLNIAARDLAKIGKIYLENGAFEGDQILPESWVPLFRDTSEQVGKWDYAMGWYFDMNEPGRDVYYGSGFNGQVLLINNTNGVIMVRLGESKSGHDWFELLAELSELL